MIPKLIKPKKKKILFTSYRYANSGTHWSPKEVYALYIGMRNAETKNDTIKVSEQLKRKYTPCKNMYRQVCRAKMLLESGY